MIDISAFVKTTKNIITANSPVLLVGAAIAGVVSTGVLAAKGGYKARGIVEDERMRRVVSPEPPFDTFREYYHEYVKKAPELTNLDKAKLTWLCYALPAVTGASSIASVLGVHVIHVKRHAALAGLYAVATTKLDEYGEKAEELLGPKKTQALNDHMAQKAVDKNDFVNNEVIITGDGNELFYDELSGRYFGSNLASIEKAAGELNFNLSKHGDVNIGQFWEDIGLPRIELGDEYGWNCNRVELRTGKAVTTNDGRSAVAVWFQPAPKTFVGDKNKNH